MVAYDAFVSVHEDAERLGWDGEPALDRRPALAPSGRVQRRRGSVRRAGVRARRRHLLKGVETGFGRGWRSRACFVEGRRMLLSFAYGAFAAIPRLLVGRCR